MKCDLVMPWGLTFIVFVYGLGVVLVRWHMMAKPIRNQLHARLETIESELLRAHPAASEKTTDTVTMLVKRAKEMQSRARSTPSDFFFWSRGQETATWQLIDEAESVLVEVWPHAKVDARLDAIVAELESSGSSKARSIAAAIKRKIDASRHGIPLADTTEHQREWVALLQESMKAERELLHEGDVELDYYSNKLMWYIGVALLTIVLLGTAGPAIFNTASAEGDYQHLGWLLAGAVGGVLSRLMLAVQKPTRANDYGLRWMALFLSPLAGALAGWAGMALLLTGAKLHVFSEQVQGFINGGGYIGVGVLFGFSERLFGQIAGSVEERVTSEKPAGAPLAKPS